MGLYDDTAESERIGVWGTVAKPQKWIKPDDQNYDGQDRERWLSEIQVYLEGAMEAAPDETCRNLIKNLWNEVEEVVCALVADRPKSADANCGESADRGTDMAGRETTEDEELKKQHPGFAIRCDKCKSSRIEIENTLGYREASGGWGEIKLKCLDCDNQGVIFTNY